jgi:hypothetical protein
MYIRNVKSIKMGDCGADGAMGAALDTVFEDIVKDTCMIDFPKPGVSFITPDDKPNPIVALIDDSNAVMKISFSTFNCSSALKATLFGGEVVLGKWSAPTTRVLKNQSVEITSGDTDGKHEVATAPKVIVVPGYSGKYNKTGMAEISVDMYVLVPKDALGADLSPFQSAEVSV